MIYRHFMLIDRNKSISVINNIARNREEKKVTKGLFILLKRPKIITLQKKKK